MPDSPLVNPVMPVRIRFDAATARVTIDTPRPADTIHPDRLPYVEAALDLLQARLHGVLNQYRHRAINLRALEEMRREVQHIADDVTSERNVLFSVYVDSVTIPPMVAASDFDRGTLVALRPDGTVVPAAIDPGALVGDVRVDSVSVLVDAALVERVRRARAGDRAAKSRGEQTFDDACTELADVVLEQIKKG